jgi:hypothetical protein
MKYPDSVMRVISEEVERHADDEEAVRAVMARITALPVYGAMVLRAWCMRRWWS